ncbi:bifunctional diguanylate cyclase/phosphodiesterase [Actinoplanes sp. Pm04-4]|uniref:Bifunctional diguanylate cyclase/phosphodiesterase n=1 Tax=Paractinoplanes pyxinae TaxID=2997416 RepID=A0ABT4BEQ0_9ACTN|nr:bifunctional diguanylate cyclase/phosphodiesterase [Actinoplanes pyxinae]MCY1144432.1 bifunctional diguanylate cyclase/phosphodiesterase [Actinoplanes pyxinae]
MTEPVGPAARRAGSGLTSLLVTAVAALAVAGWLVVRDQQDVVLGYIGGPVAMIAAVWSLQRLGAMVKLPRVVRAFWRQLGHGAVILLLSTATSLALANNNAGMSIYVAVPMLTGMFWVMSAFLRLPMGDRTPLGWARVLLDGATVAVAGALIFWYVVLSFAPPGTDLATRATAGVVGVAGLLCLAVIGKAAARPDGPIDPLALRLLAVAPIVAVALAVLLIAGNDFFRLLLSVLGSPLVALSFAAAAYRQRVTLQRPAAAPAVARRRRSAYELLPIVAIVATAALLTIVSAQQMDGRERAVIVGAVLITALVVTRQLLGVSDHRRMLAGLREQQAELERLAMTDPLTGLANRTRFTAALNERLSAHQPATVLLIDIDDFKTVNDTMGPAVGDQLLYQVAQRLQRTRADIDLPARLGGDEFAVLLDIEEEASAESAADRLIHALAEPFKVGEHLLLAHASVGVAIAGSGDTADEVLRNADIAMYAAKEGGKAAWTRFEPRMRQEVVNHARLGSELHNAIIRHELYLLYQPVFDIVTGRLHGAEALVRWKHPTRGFVSPGDFIPVAERSGLIVPLGSWVLREACEQLARWQKEHGEGAIKAINVNVAVRQLRESGFVDEVAAVLSDTGLLPRNLVLEVTESSVADGRQVRETLHALHEMGVRLALDDFGTGSSSLSLLRAFPVDVLKLDKSFVDGIADGEDRGRLAVAAAVAQLAEYLQLGAVAEGIETEAQLERLREMGYRLGQGFFMSKPLPADEAGALMSTAPVLRAV